MPASAAPDLITLPLRDYQATLPEIVLCITGLLLLVAEMVAPRKLWLMGATALLGCLLALAALGALPVTGGLDPVQPPPSRLVMFGVFVSDTYSVLFRGVVILSTGIVTLMALQYVRRFRNPGEFLALLMFAALAGMLCCGASDLLMAYLSVEFLSIVSYILVSYLKFRPRSTEAGLKYFLFGAISAAVMLYGISLLYGLTGTTALYSSDGSVGVGPALARAWDGSSADRTLLMLATSMTLVGLGFKVAMVPMHLWVPDVYEGAPTPVTAWLSVASKAAGLALLVRILVAVLPVESWRAVIALLAALTMTWGNVVALPQTNIKRLLAYSSIAHAGYVLMGIAAYRGTSAAGVGDWSLQATLLYVITYLFMNLGAFAVIIPFYDASRSHRIEEYAGLAQRAPGLALLMTLSLLSLAGLPPTAGFLGKLMLFGAAIQGGLLWLAVVGIVNTVISVYYYWNVVRQMYLRPPTDTTPVLSSTGVRWALGLSLFGTLGLFLLAQQLLELVNGRI